jgi:hypothetical protein
MGLFGVALIAYAVALPPGAAAAPAAEIGMAARAQALRGGLDPGVSALWLLLARAVGFIPLGEVVTRARLASVLAGALTAALVLGRLVTRARAALLSPPVPSPVRPAPSSPLRSSPTLPGAPSPFAAPTPSRPAPPSWSASLLSSRGAVEMVAAVLAVATVALSRSFFSAATTATPAAVGAALALGILFLAERVAHHRSDQRAGLALALVAGLGAGGPLAAAALGWPIALLLTLWALRRGERWPLLAPVIFVAGAGIKLMLVVRAPGGVALGALGRHLLLFPIVGALARLSGHALLAAAAGLGEEIGILAVLVAGLGLLTMVTAPRPDGDQLRSLAFTLWPLGAGLVLRAALGPGPDGTVGAIAAASALALPLAGGMVRMASRLGRARLPAAAAIGVIVAVWPLLAR